MEAVSSSVAIRFLWDYSPEKSEFAWKVSVKNKWIGTKSINKSQHTLCMPNPFVKCKRFILRRIKYQWNFELKSDSTMFFHLLESERNLKTIKTCYVDWCWRFRYYKKSSWFSLVKIRGYACWDTIIYLFIYYVFEFFSRTNNKFN